MAYERENESVALLGNQMKRKPQHKIQKYHNSEAKKMPNFKIKSTKRS